MKVGYIRVSTKEQNTLRQEEAMKELGVEKIFLEKVSGKETTNRPQLKEMLSYVREGDLVVVHEYSRLARNGADLVNIIDSLKKKGVGFKSIKENIDTTTPEGKFFFFVMCGMAEFERELIKKRQREGIDAALENGVKFGRKVQEYNEDDFKKVYNVWKSGGCSAVEAMKSLNMKPNKWYDTVARVEGRYKRGYERKTVKG